MESGNPLNPLPNCRYLQSGDPEIETSMPCNEDDIQNTEEIMTKLRAKGK